MKKTIKIFLVMFLVFIPFMTKGINAEESVDDWMPDKNLQEIIRKQLNLESVNGITKTLLENQYIQLSDMAELETVENVRGLEYVGYLYASFILDNPTTDYVSIWNLLEPVAPNLTVSITGRINWLFPNGIDFSLFSKYKGLNFDPHNSYFIDKKVVLNRANFDSFEVDLSTLGITGSELLNNTTQNYSITNIEDNYRSEMYMGILKNGIFKFTRSLSVNTFDDWEGFEASRNLGEINYIGYNKISFYMGAYGALNIAFDLSIRDSYEINFDSMGGSSVESQFINNGGLAARPVTPEKDGYEFISWFEDEELTSEYNFESKTVTKDITLYAKWKEKGLVDKKGIDKKTKPPITVVEKQGQDALSLPPNTNDMTNITLLISLMTLAELAIIITIRKQKVATTALD